MCEKKPVEYLPPIVNELWIKQSQLDDEVDGWNLSDICALFMGWTHHWEDSRGFNPDYGEIDEYWLAPKTTSTFQSPTYNKPIEYLQADFSEDLADIVGISPDQSALKIGREIAMLVIQGKSYLDYKGD